MPFAGVPEYWIIDEMEKTITFLRLGPRGKYREIKPRKGVFYSEALEGFWFRPEWLWQEPPPNFVEKLQEILGA